MSKKNILIFFLLIQQTIYSQTPGSNLFDDSFLHEIRFENADTNTYINTYDYQQLNMIIDGNTVNNVGFKKKGNISGYPTTNKFGIKIKTNKYVNAQKYDGTKEFTLHMNYQDPTMMREKLTYDICSEMGLFSLRTAFAKVYINNIYWGLFTIVEGKDEMYKQVFNHRDMDAIESLDFGDMCYISNTPSDYDFDSNGGNPTYKFENGNTVTAWPLFSKMVDKTNNTPDNQYLDTVPKYLNLEDFFVYQAVNVYLMNHDSYIGFRGNQIYVFDTLNKVWQVTPWDFNASFGLWDTGNHSPSSYPMIPGTISNGCIASKMDDFSILKSYYLDAMCQLNNSVGDTLAYFAKIDAIKDQIQQAVYDDTRKVISNSDFDAGINYGYHTLFGEDIPALKTLIRERLLVVKSGLISEGYNCTSTASVISPDSEPLMLFPNPATDAIFLKNKGNTTITKAAIYNSAGQRVIYQLQVTGQAIDVSELPSGLYWIKLEDQSGVRTGKFVKQ